MSDPIKSGVCIHKTLRRNCETCDLADDFDAVMAEVRAWRAADNGGMNWNHEAAMTANVLCAENIERGLK
jgi:hypothetical protein